MKKTIVALFITLAFSVSAAFAGNLSFKGKCDKNPLEYEPGETMTFTVECFDDDQPAENVKLRWIRSGDDGERESQDVVYNKEPLVITTSIKTPGFVRIQVVPINENGEIIGGEHAEHTQFNGGAGVLLDEIKGIPEPEDFDAFWDRQKAILAQVPIKYTLTPVENNLEDVVSYDVKVDCSGLTPVSGYLSMPKDAKEKSLPARVQYQGYSVAPIGLNAGAGRGQIYFEINCHGILNGQAPEYYQTLQQTFLKSYGFPPESNQDPNSSYWCGMMMRALRAVQFVKSLPEWDGVNLTTGGGSQGGMQCLSVAGLDSDVTEVDAVVPWFCDVSGAERSARVDSWFMPAWVDPLGYFDTTNHAKRIKGKVRIFAGLGDYVCPPSGEMVLFNAIKTEKRIQFRQGKTHGYESPGAEDFVLEAAAQE